MTLVVKLGSPDVDHVDVEFDHSDLSGGSLSIGYCSAGRYVQSVAFKVLSAFDDGIQFTIGDSSAHARLMEAAQSDPETLGEYKNDPDVKYDVRTEIVLYVIGVPSQGSGSIIIGFQ